MYIQRCRCGYFWHLTASLLITLHFSAALHSLLEDSSLPRCRCPSQVRAALILHIPGVLLQWGSGLFLRYPDKRNVDGVSAARGIECLCWLSAVFMSFICISSQPPLQEVLLGSLGVRIPLLRCWPYPMRSGYGSCCAGWTLTDWRSAYSWIASSFCSLMFSFSQSVLLKWSLVFFA